MSHRPNTQYMPHPTPLVSRSAWARARAGLAAEHPGGSAVEFKTLPVAELVMGLGVLFISRSLAVGSEVSLARTGLLFGVCGLVAAYGIIFNPYAPFYVYAFVAPTFAAFGTSFALIAGGTVAVFLNRAQTQWKWQFSWVGLAFCLWAIAGLMWAEQVSLKQDSFLAIVLPPMLLAFVLSGIRDAAFRRNFLLLVVAACVVGSVASLRHWSAGLVEFAGGVRVYSLIRPDVFSAWELLGLFGALAWLLAGRPTLWLRCLLILSLPVILLGLGLCGYRAAIVAAGAGVLVLGICQKQILRGLAFVGLFVAVVSCLYVIKPAMFEPVVSRFKTIQEDRGSTRLDLWQDSLRLFNESPVVGVGSDNFSVRTGAMPHSIYVGTLVELGIVGFLLLLCWIGVLLHKAWRAQDRLWVMPVLAAYLCQAAFLHQFYFSCFWLAIGFAEGAAPAQPRTATDQRRAAQQRPAGAPSSSRRGIALPGMLPMRLMRAGARLVRRPTRRRLGRVGQ